MSTISAPSLQAYRAWAEPVRTQPRQVQPPAQDPATRGSSVVVNLSPQAEKLTAQMSAAKTQLTENMAAFKAAGSYLETAGSEAGAGRREAPFAHRDEAIRYQPPGRVLDRTV